MVSEERSLIVCDMNNKCLVIVTADGEETAKCSTSPYEPLGICLNHRQQPVVCSWESVIVYSSDLMSQVQEIKYEKNGGQLFVCAYRVFQNGNHDYCVVDNIANTVLAVDEDQTLRWTYHRGPDRNRFNPWNVCCDLQQNVIIADTVNNKVHLLDSDGYFIMYVMTKMNVSRPRGLGMGCDGALWVGENEKSRRVHIVRCMYGE